MCVGVLVGLEVPYIATATPARVKHTLVAALCPFVVLWAPKALYHVLPLGHRDRDPIAFKPKACAP